MEGSNNAEVVKSPEAKVELSKTMVQRVSSELPEGTFVWSENRDKLEKINLPEGMSLVCLNLYGGSDGASDKTALVDRPDEIAKVYAGQSSAFYPEFVLVPTDKLAGCTEEKRDEFMKGRNNPFFNASGNLDTRES